jgi:hypothetical protein
MSVWLYHHSKAHTAVNHTKRYSDKDITVTLIIRSVKRHVDPRYLVLRRSTVLALALWVGPLIFGRIL